MSPDTFSYESLAARVLFGWDAIHRLPAEIDRIGAKRVLVLSTLQQAKDAERVMAIVSKTSVGLFSGAVMHTPVEVTAQALETVTRVRADALVSFGGGSTIGLGKAIAIRNGMHHIALPTTYAGSEATPILGETDKGVKTTRRDPRILPTLVIYDPELTLNLPRSISATSGLNAMAHAVEALYAQDRNPIISIIAEEGIKAFARALPRIARDLHDREARATALYGAWLCGTALGNVGMALHHKICHVLGGSFDLSHAETHAVMLPHVLAFNAGAAPQAVAALGRAFDSNQPLKAFREFCLSLGVPTSLSQLGMTEVGLDRAADLAVANPYWNPRNFNRADIRALLEGAWKGDWQVEATDRLEKDNE